MKVINIALYTWVGKLWLSFVRASDPVTVLDREIMAVFVWHIYGQVQIKQYLLTIGLSGQ